MLMNFLMTAAPLAMQMCGLSQESCQPGAAVARHRDVRAELLHRTADHALRGGRIVVAGLLLTGLSAAVGLTGIDVAHFWLTLILLGVGWNFGFIGASALVLECHRPEERTRVQSLNDFIVFGTMAVGSFASGGLLAAYDWNVVLWVSFVPLALAVVALTRTGSAKTPVTVGDSSI